MREKTQSPGAMDHFLYMARQKRETVDVFLRGATKLTGRIKGFDGYSILLDQDGVESLVYKSAVATVRKFKYKRFSVPNRFGLASSSSATKTPEESNDIPTLRTGTSH